MKTILMSIQELSWMIGLHNKKIINDAEGRKVIRIMKNIIESVAYLPTNLCGHYVSDITDYDRSSPYYKAVHGLIDRSEEKYRWLFRYSILQEGVQAMFFYWFVMLQMVLKGIPFSKGTRFRDPEPYKRRTGEYAEDSPYELSKTIDLRQAHDAKNVADFIKYFFGFISGTETSDISDHLDPYDIVTGNYAKSLAGSEITGEAEPSPEQGTKWDRELAMFSWIEMLSEAMGVRFERSRILNDQLYNANTVAKFTKVIIGHLKRRRLLMR